MNRLIKKYVFIALFLLLSILFVAKSAGPSILRLYVETGIGTCKKIPILCREPEKETVSLDINKDFVELHPYKFPKVEIAVPRGFEVVWETIKKVYYKKKKSPQAGAVVYLLYEPPDFFIGLFPQLRKEGKMDNYEFIRRVMFANIKNIGNLTDAFFVIMKSIFIPDLGNLQDVRMVQFKLSGKRGFINYNLEGKDNYFDCNIIDDAGDYFKVYIKDKGARLDLNKTLTIISTVRKKD
jgi:hypothetical protein